MKNADLNSLATCYMYVSPSQTSGSSKSCITGIRELIVSTHDSEYDNATGIAR
jgi:hypothetical protein